MAEGIRLGTLLPAFRLIKEGQFTYSQTRYHRPNFLREVQKILTMDWIKTADADFQRVVRITELCETGRPL
jgi:hypothetical protein